MLGLVQKPLPDEPAVSGIEGPICNCDYPYDYDKHPHCVDQSKCDSKHWCSGQNCHRDYSFGKQYPCHGAGGAFDCDCHCIPKKDFHTPADDAFECRSGRVTPPQVQTIKNHFKGRCDLPHPLPLGDVICTKGDDCNVCLECCSDEVASCDTCVKDNCGTICTSGDACNVCDKCCSDQGGNPKGVASTPLGHASPRTIVCRGRS